MEVAGLLIPLLMRLCSRELRFEPTCSEETGFELIRDDFLFVSLNSQAHFSPASQPIAQHFQIVETRMRIELI